jgi:hypothetical protein
VIYGASCFSPTYIGIVAYVRRGMNRLRETRGDKTCQMTECDIHKPAVVVSLLRCKFRKAPTKKK